MKIKMVPHDPPVNILGGYKFPNAPDVKLREERRGVIVCAARWSHTRRSQVSALKLN